MSDLADARSIEELLDLALAAGGSPWLLASVPEWRKGTRPDPATAHFVDTAFRRYGGASLGEVLDSAGDVALDRLPFPARRRLIGDLARTLGIAQQATPGRDTAGLAPGRTREEILDWGRHHGVEDVLNWTISALSNSEGFRWHNIVWSVGPHLTVASLLAAPSVSPEGRKIAPPPAPFRAWILAWLQARAVENGRGVTAEATWLAEAPVPRDPHLAEAAARLGAALRAHRQSAPPGAWVRVTPGRPIADPPSISFHSAGRAMCSGRVVYDDVVVDLSTDSVVVRCGCRPEAVGTCRTVSAALLAAMQILCDPKALLAPLARSLSVPSWMRTLDALDLVIGSVDADAVATAMLGWAIDPDRHRIEPVKVEAKAKGGWKIVLYPGAELKAAIEAAPEEVDEQIAALLGLSTWRDSQTAPERTFARVIPLLEGHPRVFAWPEKTAIRVRRAALRMEVTPEGDAVRLDPVVDGKAVVAASLRERFTLHQGEAVAGWLDPSKETLSYLRTPPAVPRLLGLLADRGHVFPAAALPELLRRLPALARYLPVRTADVAGVRRVAGDPTPIAFLERLPGDAIGLRLRVRPVAGAPLLPPGEGGDEVVVHEAGALVVATRDGDAERAGMERVLNHTGLGLPEEGGAAWTIEDPERAIDVLMGLRALGDAVRVEWRAKSMTVTREARAADLKVKVGAASEWFGVSGSLEVEGSRVPLAALLEAVDLGRSFVRVGADTWIRIETGLRKKLAELAQVSGPGATPMLAPVHAGAIEGLADAGARVEGDQDWRDMLVRFKEAAEFSPPMPDGLVAELRPYQAVGITWALRLARWAGGAVLADDMGLGKTIQALAVLLDRSALGPALVVAPTSVGFNWVREATRFAPSLDVRLHRGADRERSLSGLLPGDVIVTSYDLLFRDVDDWKIRFATVVFDEAHALKNPDTRRAEAARKVNADFRLALTGTPIENRLSELWSLFHVVLPGVFGGWQRFRERFAVPIEVRRDAERRQVLSRVIRPFVLRRTKGEVARDLPERTEIRIDVELEGNAKHRYDELRTGALAALAGLDPSVPPERRRFIVLAALTRLRQLACHPALVDPSYTGGSPKLDALLDLATELRAEGRKMLIFSQFTEHLALVRAALEGAGFQLRYLDGSTPAAAREAEVTAFSAGEGDAFLLSIKAGGTGLNLTAASDVVILDPWWNPAVEDQAAGRAHRIGQTRKVTIYRIVARETVEEQILALHATKRELISGVLDGTGGGGSLSVDELMGLLRGE